jgi:hypothetical protein
LRNFLAKPKAEAAPSNGRGPGTVAGGCCCRLTKREVPLAVAFGLFQLRTMLLEVLGAVKGTGARVFPAVVSVGRLDEV